MTSLASTRLADQAVYNNAVWCDTICKAHGNPGVFEPGIWFNTKSVPRFYPNAVTLTRTQEEQYSSIKKLITEEMIEHFGVKDSFASLNLDELGFTTLFEAEWLWLSPEVAMPLNHFQDIQWQIVKNPDELMHWEVAWNNGELGDNARIFLPNLLDNPDVIFIAGYKQQHIVAGAIGNRTGEVVGYLISLRQAIWQSIIGQNAFI